MCIVCNGHVNCPVCEAPVVEHQCEECNGTGGVLVNEDGYFLQYDGVNIPSGYELDPCDKCNGEGTIIEED